MFPYDPTHMPPGDPAMLQWAAKDILARRIEFEHYVRQLQAAATTVSDWTGAGADVFNRDVNELAQAINQVSAEVASFGDQVKSFASQLEELQSRWKSLVAARVDGSITAACQAVTAAITEALQAQYQREMAAYQAAISRPAASALLPKDSPSGIGGPSSLFSLTPSFLPPPGGNTYAVPPPSPEPAPVFDVTVTLVVSKALAAQLHEVGATYAYVDTGGTIASAVAAAVRDVTATAAAFAQLAQDYEAFVAGGPAMMDMGPSENLRSGALGAWARIQGYLTTFGGSKVVLPPPAAHEAIPLAAAGSIQIKVQPGDNLTQIAQRFYGTSDYSKVYDQNKSVIGGNPNLIYAGQVLTLAAPTAGGTWYVQAPPAPPAPLRTPSPGVRRVPVTGGAPVDASAPASKPAPPLRTPSPGVRRVPVTGGAPVQAPAPKPAAPPPAPNSGPGLQLQLTDSNFDILQNAPVFTTNAPTPAAAAASVVAWAAKNPNNMVALSIGPMSYGSLQVYPDGGGYAVGGLNGSPTIYNTAAEARKAVASLIAGCGSYGS